MKNPRCPRTSASARTCGAPVGRSPRRPARAHRGLLPQVPQPVLVHAQAEGRATSSAASTRSPAASPTAASAGSTSPATSNVSDRWVVLKGLLNSGDPDALAAAIAERQFLAQVEHPLIVEIYNFVTHEGAGYIVMEYVGGTSLKQILKERMRGQRAARTTRCRSTRRSPTSSRSCRRSSTCTTSACVYCDFKPDNLIQVGDAVKLIDLGGVRRARRPRLRDLRHGRLPGARGGRASGRASPRDIYTIGRTLVVLRDGVPRLPDAPTSPRCRRSTRRRCSSEYDSLYRLLLKACAPDPADRFAVGRRAARAAARRAARGRRRRRATGAAEHSTSSAAVRRRRTVADDSLDWQDLPAPAHRRRATRRRRGCARVSIDDPGAAPGGAASGAGGQPPRCCSPGRAPRSRPGSSTGSTTRSRAAAGRRPVGVARGLDVGPRRARAAADWREAQSAFNAVYGQVPGELAPKLALAFACETGGDTDVAEELYVVCARTDANYIAPAAFGLARIRAGRGRRRRARSRRSTSCPSTSRALHRRRGGAGPGCSPSRAVACPSLAAALDSIESLTIDPRRPVALPRRGAQRGAGPGASRTGADTTVRHRRARPRPSRPCATGSRRPTATWPGSRPSREERVAPRRPGQRGPPLDAAMTSTTGREAGASARPATALPCPSCASPVAAGERFCEACGADLGASARGRRAAPAPTAAGRPARRRAATAPDGRTAAAVPRVRRRGRRRRLLHAVRGQGRRARATTSPSSRRRGSAACATAASGTPATRTPSRSPPGPSRAAAPCSSSATGSRPRPTPTSPAWPRPGPRATCWPARRAAGRSGTRRHAGSRRAPRRSWRRPTRPTTP